MTSQPRRRAPSAAKEARPAAIAARIVRSAEDVAVAGRFLVLLRLKDLLDLILGQVLPVDDLVAVGHGRAERRRTLEEIGMRNPGEPVVVEVDLRRIRRAVE